MDTKGIFKRKYGKELKGRGWIKAIEPEDRALLIEIGMRAMEWGRLGGAARASKAKRDAKGRFTREDGTNNIPEPIQVDWMGEFQSEPASSRGINISGFEVVARGSV